MSRRFTRVGMQTGKGLDSLVVASNHNLDARFRTGRSARPTLAAVGTFGSGWAWLLTGKGVGLEILTTGNADNPLTEDRVPLLTCDVWEHVCYIDYRNARAEYLNALAGC